MREGSNRLGCFVTHLDRKSKKGKDSQLESGALPIQDSDERRAPIIRRPDRRST